MEKNILSGRMYCLDEVVDIEDAACSIYLLRTDGNCDKEISFGRNRKINVPKESYIIKLSDSWYKIEKIEFDSDGKCDYLKNLKEKGVSYTIPKRLEPSISRMYSRFECAIGATWWSKCTHGYFADNGYAMESVGYIGDDRYEDFVLVLNQHTCVFKIGNSIINSMTCCKVPTLDFIEEVLGNGIHVDEGEEMLKLLKQAGLLEVMEYIEFDVR